MINRQVCLFFLFICINIPFNNNWGNICFSAFLTKPIDDEINFIIDEFTVFNLSDYKEVSYGFIQSITTDEFGEINLKYTKPEFAQFYLIKQKLPISGTISGYIIFIRYPLNSKPYKTHDKVSLILVDREGYFLNQKIIYQDYDLNGEFIGLNSRIIDNRIQMVNTSTNTLSYYQIDNEGFFEEISPFYNLNLQNRLAIEELTSEVLTKSDLNISPTMFFEKQKNKQSSLMVFRNEDLTLIKSYVVAYKEYDYYKSFFIINELKSLHYCVYELAEAKYLLSNDNWIGTKCLEYYDCEEEFSFLLR